MISISKTLRSAAALCMILTAGISFAQEGVVRLSDRGNTLAPDGAGVVRMTGSRGPAIQRTSFVMADGSCSDQWSTQGCTVQGCQSCSPGNNGMCSSGNCDNGSCYTSRDCNSYFSSCDASGMPACWCQQCQSSPCQCGGRGGRRDGSFGDIHRDHVNTLFAGSVDCGTGSTVRDCWRGQSLSFRNKNARLGNLLFGWMVPSGGYGQGAPLVGAYHVTYANQPDYIDQRDTQLYAAQGYGMPITVPLAPNVNHTYNYSAGIPASRVTHIGNYNPQTSPRPLYHQTW